MPRGCHSAFFSFPRALCFETSTFCVSRSLCPGPKSKVWAGEVDPKLPQNEAKWIEDENMHRCPSSIGGLPGVRCVRNFHCFICFKLSPGGKGSFHDGFRRAPTLRQTHRYVDMYIYIIIYIYIHTMHMYSCRQICIYLYKSYLQSLHTSVCIYIYVLMYVYVHTMCTRDVYVCTYCIQST